MSSRATIRLFAGLAEASGSDTVAVPLPPGATAQSVLARLSWFQPRLARLLPGCRVARDNEFLAPQDPVSANDVLSIIPPTSGG